ncbi:MAG: M13 family metallopeptidase [Sphingobacteriales bacterium]|nr:M13 family metallopeptidase [Sphingobacteriales bacterium]
MKKQYMLLGTAIVMVAAAFVLSDKLTGVDTASLNRKAKPQDDFFEFANGGWIKANPIPTTEGRWGSFNALAERNNELLRKILEEAAADKNAEPGTARQKIGDFYSIAMDTLKLERDGLAPVALTMQLVESWQNTNDLATILAGFHKRGISGFFNMYVGLDVKNNEKYVTWLSQGGLGLPDRDYYLKDDEKSKKIREAYMKHLAKMFMIFGAADADAQANAAMVLELETGLAQNSMSRVENRNMEKKYNKFAYAKLKNDYASFNWDAYFELTGLAVKKVDTVIVAQPDYFTYLQTIFNKEPQIIRAYLKWKVMSAVSSYLTAELEKQTFSFYGTVIQGVKEQKPRWKRAVASANGMLGQLVAQEYVKVAFSPQSKEKVNQMVDHLREAFRNRINNLEWMSAETKQKALEKLNSFNRKLGYPDKWEDYSKLSVKRDSYLDNYFRAQVFGFEDMVDQLNKPVDKTKWSMLPQTVNAYYSPVMNEIVFPAAIMQPPFFDPNRDDAANYGAIGAVIGHEFSHGFDDQGSKYDAKGNLNSWWTDEDRKKFEERTKVLVEQFNKFEVLDSVFVNGQLTLGENIADLAGLTVAYEAYQMSIKDKKRVIIDGFTPEQRFFIGFAQVWRTHARPEYLRNQVLTDPHSPAQYRVFGPLSNMPQFYAAFDVKPKHKMWLDDNKRVKIW